MRAGPLADKTVIALLNSHFIPVYAVNEDYRDKGPKPADEKAEYKRVFKESYAAKLSTGTVHVYLLTPGGHPFDSLHVANAAKTENLIAALQRAVEKFKVPAGDPLIKPAAQSIPPECDPGSLILHLVSRSLGGGGSWGGVVENWIVLTADEQAKLAGDGSSAVGASRPIDKDVATSLLTDFYPSTENNDVSKNRFLKEELNATLIGITNGVARTRLEGAIKMEHSFYHKDDGKVVEATVLGFFDFEAKTKRILSLNLATEEATYGGGKFAVGVQSLANFGR